MSTKHTTSDGALGRRSLATGLLAVVGAAAVVPVVNAIRPLYFVAGTVVTLAVPSGFGSVGECVFATGSARIVHRT